MYELKLTQEADDVASAVKHRVRSSACKWETLEVDTKHKRIKGNLRVEHEVAGATHTSHVEFSGGTRDKFSASLEFGPRDAKQKVDLSSLLFDKLDAFAF